jgi:F-type H+-transporting ATPase subunit delta
MARRDTAPRRFAEAAFQIALRDDTLETWRRELDLAAATLLTGDLEPILSNPAISVEQRIDAAQQIFVALSEPVRNLVVLLLRRGRIEQLSRVAQEFARLDDQRQGLTHATATSAAPLDAKERKAIVARLEELIGGRVELQTEVDPHILGGLVVRIGDRLIDGSVLGRLERLRNQLASGAL